MGVTSKERSLRGPGKGQKTVQLRATPIFQPESVIIFAVGIKVLISYLFSRIEEQHDVKLQE